MILGDLMFVDLARSETSMRVGGGRIRDEVDAKKIIRKRHRLRTLHAKGRTLPNGSGVERMQRQDKKKNMTKNRKTGEVEGVEERTPVETGKLVGTEVEGYQARTHHASLYRGRSHKMRMLWQKQSEGRLPKVLQRNVHYE